MNIEEITSEILPHLKAKKDFWGNNHEIDSNRFIDLTHLNIDLTGVAFKNGYQMTPQVDSCLSKRENVFVGFWVREIWVKSMLLSHHNQKLYCKTTDWVPLLLRPDLFLFYPWIYWLKSWWQITLKLGIIFSKLGFVFITGKLLLVRVYSCEVSGRPKVVYYCQVCNYLLFGDS